MGAVTVGVSFQRTSASVSGWRRVFQLLCSMLEGYVRPSLTSAAYTISRVRPKSDYKREGAPVTCTALAP